MAYIFGIWGEAKLILRILGAKKKYFQGVEDFFPGIWGDQCIFFRDQGCTDPPGASDIGYNLILYFFIADGSSINVYSDTPPGSIINQIMASDSDLSIGNDFIRYYVKDETKFTPWDYPDVTRNDERLFFLDDGNRYLTFIPMKY